MFSSLTAGAISPGAYPLQAGSAVRTLDADPTLVMYLGGQTMATDATATNVVLKGRNAYAQSSTDKYGSSVDMAGGIGRLFWTIVDYSLIDSGVDTVTLYVNGTATVITAGTGWVPATSNAITATALATYINTLALGVTALGVGSSCYITPGISIKRCYLATSMAAGEGTVTNGGSGGVWFHGSNGGHMRREYAPLLTYPVSYVNETGHYFSMVSMTISGDTTPNGDFNTINPPSADPFMLGLWSDIDGPTFQARSQNSGVLTSARAIDVLDHSANHTLSIKEDGRLSWGTGTYAGQDTFLYRSSAGILEVDDGSHTGSLIVGSRVTCGNMLSNGQVVLQGQSAATTGIVAGIAAGYSNAADLGFIGTHYMLSTDGSTAACDTEIKRSAVTGIAVLKSDGTGAVIEGQEQTAPAVAPTNGYRIFADGGGAGGKSRLMVIFQSGAGIPIALEL